MKRIYKSMALVFFCMSFLISFNGLAQDDEIFEVDDVSDGLTYLTVDGVRFFIMEGDSPVEVELDYFKTKWEAQLLDEEGEAVVLETFMIMRSELDADEVTYMLKAMSADGIVEMGEFIQPQSSLKNPNIIPANAYLVID